MSTASLERPSPGGAPSIVPDWVHDLATYRQWAHSDDYPQSGWISYLAGVIWVDMSMEELITHNQVKQAYAFAVGHRLMTQPTGRYVGDRMLLTNPEAELSTEPDGLYFAWETVQLGRLRFVSGKHHGFMELEGTPDMVLEIVSATSERKDKKTLRDLYWKAKVPEYWLVDARKDPAEFDVLRWAATGYEPMAAAEGWLPSSVLGCSLRLLRTLDPLGYPQFVVETR
jgi:Uma2 family endonuclease